MQKAEFEPSAYLEAHRELLLDSQVVTTGNISNDMQEVLPCVESEVQEWLYTLASLDTAQPEDPIDASQNVGSFVEVVKMFAIISERAARKGLDYPHFTSLDRYRTNAVTAELFRQTVAVNTVINPNSRSIFCSKRPLAVLYHSPERTQDFLDTFGKALGPSTVRDVITHSPKKTEARLVEILSMVEVLHGKFPRFNRTDIIQAATDYRDPDQYLQAIEDTIQTISQHPVLRKTEPWVVRRAIMRSKEDPVTAVEQMLQKIQELQDEFGGEFGVGTYTYVAASHADPKTFIETAMRVVGELQIEFQGYFSDSYLKNIAIHVPDDPASYLRNVQKRAEALLSQYSGTYTRPQILRALRNQPSSPEEYLANNK